MISDQVPYAKLEEAVQRIEMCSELTTEEKDMAAHFLLSHPIAAVLINSKAKEELPRYLRSLKGLPTHFSPAPEPPPTMHPAMIDPTTISINTNLLLSSTLLGAPAVLSPVSVSPPVMIQTTTLGPPTHGVLQTIHMGRVLYCQLCHQKKKGHKCARVACPSQEHCGVSYLHNTKSLRRQRKLEEQMRNQPKEDEKRFKTSPESKNPSGAPIV